MQLYNKLMTQSEDIPKVKRMLSNALWVSFKSTRSFHFYKIFYMFQSKCDLYKQDLHNKKLSHFGAQS